jgi:hypothetical protein
MRRSFEPPANTLLSVISVYTENTANIAKCQAAFLFQLFASQTLSLVE